MGGPLFLKLVKADALQIFYAKPVKASTPTTAENLLRPYIENLLWPLGTSLPSTHDEDSVEGLSAQPTTRTQASGTEVFEEPQASRIETRHV